MYMWCVQATDARTRKSQTLGTTRFRWQDIYSCLSTDWHCVDGSGPEKERPKPNCEIAGFHSTRPRMPLRPPARSPHLGSARVLGKLYLHVHNGGEQAQCFVPLHLSQVTSVMSYAWCFVPRATFSVHPASTRAPRLPAASPCGGSDRFEL